MEPLAQRQTHQHPQKRQGVVLPEHIGRCLSGIEAKHLDGGDLPDALVDIDVGEVIQHDKGQRPGAHRHHPHDVIQHRHHGSHPLAGIQIHRYRRDVLQIQNPGRGGVDTCVGVIRHPDEGGFHRRHAAPLIPAGVR